MLNIKKYLYILIYFTCAVNIKAVVIDQKVLYYWAESEGFGYKYANLRELEKLAQNTSSQGYEIKVPQFAGIASPRIQEFLKKEAHLDIVSRWRDIITKYYGDPKEQQRAQQSRKYKAEFLSESAKLEEEIKQAFVIYADKIKGTTSNLAIFNNNNISSLFELSRKNNERLMVRSSGREDTAQLANAGGNVSVANVMPDESSVINAMGEVVASYFGANSLKQRLGAKDETLFDGKTPLTPVLLQRMIAETGAHDITKCGVMFTEEAEGNISSKHAPFAEAKKVPTSGITIIQAAYGHNEAVVNSRINVDSYYVTESKHIYPVITPKTHRLVPSLEEQKVLNLVENPLELQNKSSLSKEAILALKAFADELENFYLNPMDVEFVINEKEKVIYIVQARPIVAAKNNKEPSYLKNLAQFSPKNIKKGSAIGTAGGSLRYCDSKQTILASNINDALTQYEDDAGIGDPMNIECVIIGKMAPSTSHEASTFRSEGKAVIYIKDWQEIEKWLEDPQARILVSPQQGVVLKYSGAHQSLAQLLADSTLTGTGWANYPIPAQLSLVEEFLPASTNLEKQAAYFAEHAQNTERGKYSIEELLDLLAITQDNKLADQSIAALLGLIGKIYEHVAHDIEITPGKKKRIRMLISSMLHAAAELRENLKYQQNSEYYIRRLLPLRMLQSLFFQDESARELIDGGSYAKTVERELLGAQALGREFKERALELDTTSLAYMRIRALAMTPLLAKQWELFVIKLAQLEDDSIKHDFEMLIRKIHALEMLPIWLHTSFAEAYENSEPVSVSDIAKQLIEEEKSQAAFFSYLAELDKKMSVYNINIFSNPKNFDANWRTFSKDILEDFLGTKLKDYYDSANKLAKNAGISVKTKFVNKVFDRAIKALTGAKQAYNSETLRAERFRLMLLSYYELFKAQGVKLDKDQEKVLNSILFSKNAPSEADFKRSGANIIAWTYGTLSNSVNLGRLKKPETLEEAFQIIHQSLLVALAQEATKAGLAQISRPEVLRAMEESIFINRKYNPRYEKDIPQARLLSVSISPDTFELIYNQPLRNHSGQFSLIYHKNLKQVSLKGAYIGEARTRWEEIVKLLKLFEFDSALFSMKILDTKITNDALEFELLFKGSQAPALASWIYHRSNEITMAESGMPGLEYNEIIKDMLAIYEKSELSPEKVAHMLWKNARLYLDFVPEERIASISQHLLPIFQNVGGLWAEEYFKIAPSELSQAQKLLQELLSSPNINRKKASRILLSALPTLVEPSNFMEIINKLISAESNDDLRAEARTIILDTLEKTPNIASELLLLARQKSLSSYIDDYKWGMKVILEALNKINYLTIENLNTIAKTADSKEIIDNFINQILEKQAKKIFDKRGAQALKRLKNLTLTKDNFEEILGLATDLELKNYYDRYNPLITYVLEMAQEAYKNPELNLLAKRLVNEIVAKDFHEAKKIKEEFISKDPVDTASILKHLKSIEPNADNVDEFVNLATKAINSSEEANKDLGWQLVGKLYGKDFVQAYNLNLPDKDKEWRHRFNHIVEFIRSLQWPFKQDDKKKLDNLLMQIKFFDDMGDNEMDILATIRNGLNKNIYDYIISKIY